MRVIGIIAEYNPFHNGHEYLISRARELVGDKRAVVLAVMSGPFTQRGLPSVLPKHVRASQALKCGADLVLELPFTFACAPSERFASGAVELLYRTGVVTDIAWGVDCEDPSLLSTLAGYDFESSDVYTSLLKASLSDGASFPSARAEAIVGAVKAQGLDIGEDLLRNTLRQPNSILALDYLRAMRHIGAHFKVHMIPRVGSGYSSDDIVADRPSASAIRSELFSLQDHGHLSVAAAAVRLAGKMPDSSLAAALHAWQSGLCRLPDRDRYANDILNRIAVSSSSELDRIAYMSDGLSGYLLNKVTDIRAGEALFDKMAEKLVTKHFTMPRIYRSLASMLVGQSAEYIMEETHPRFIRVLGFGKEGRYCLKIMGKCARLPIIHNCSDALELYSSDEALKSQFELDLAAGNVAASYLGMPYNSEWETPPVRI